MGRQWTSGTSRPGSNREAGPIPAPAAQRKLTVNRTSRSRSASNKPVKATREVLHTAEYLCGAEVPDGDWIERRSPGSAGMPPARRRRSRGRERVTQRRYAVCSVRVPGRGPSSDRAGEHESGFVVDSDGRTRFYRLVAVHDAPAVGEVAAPHVDPLRGAVIGVKAHADARHRAPC